MKKPLRNLCLVFMSLVFLGLSGCIEVTSIDPVSNATGVARDAVITFRFSVVPDASTVNSTNIILKDSSSSIIACDITLASNVVTVKPQSLLNFLTKYTLTVKKDVKDAEKGQGMQKDYVSSFTTIDSMSWKAPVAISGAGNNASAPQVAMDNKGNAIIAWYQSDGTYSRIYRSEYRSGAWGAATVISSAGKDAYSPRIAMDNNGKAIMVWFQMDGSSARIFRTEYKGTSWTTPAAISTSGRPTCEQQAFMDKNGNAIIVWRQNDSGKERIYRTELRGSSWSTPAPISDLATSAYNPQAAMDNNGNAVIVWKQTDASDMRVLKTEYRSGAWNAPLAISPTGTDACSFLVGPLVDMDDNGNAIIAWHQSDGTNVRVYKKEYRSGAWSATPDIVSNPGSNASVPNLSMDNLGNAVLTWLQSDGSNTLVYRQEYRLGTWLPVPIVTSIYWVDAYGPDIATDNNGNILVTWYALDSGKNRVFRSEYRGGSWNLAPTPVSNASTDASAAQSASDDNGCSLIVWQQSDGTNQRIYRSDYR
jgi:hypothetical protein